jgi:hypothetical protein
LTRPPQVALVGRVGTQFLMLQPRSTSELLHINACGGLAGDTFVCFIIFVFETHLLWVLFILYY